MAAVTSKFHQISKVRLAGCPGGKSLPPKFQERGISSAFPPGVCQQPPPPRKCRQNGAFGVGPPAPGWDGAHWVARLVRSELSLRSDTDGSDAPPGPSVSDNFCVLDRPRRAHRRRRVPVMYSIGRAWRHFPWFFRLRDGKTEYFGGATGTKWVFS